MGLDCCRPPQLRFVGLQYLFFAYTQGYAADAAPPWAITLSPRVAGLRIPLAYGSQTNLQLPIYRPKRTYQDFPQYYRNANRFPGIQNSSPALQDALILIPQRNTRHLSPKKQLAEQPRLLYHTRRYEKPQRHRNPAFPPANRDGALFSHHRHTKAHPG